MSKNALIVCPSCGRKLDAEDRYCRYCGADCRTATPYVERPEEDFFRCVAPVYGPALVRRIHKCENKRCGFAWETFEMFDNESCCPKCGSRVSVKELRDRR